MATTVSGVVRVEVKDLSRFMTALLFVQIGIFVLWPSLGRLFHWKCETLECDS